MPVHRRLQRAVKSALSKLPGRRPKKALPARKARRAETRGNGPTIDERLAHIAADVRAGKHVELSWELFRLNCFPGWPHERVAAALGLWSTRQRIKVSFEARDIEAGGAIIPATACVSLRGERTSLKTTR
jgi:hypothetical protein